MAFISITRLRLRSIRFLPLFFVTTGRTLRQVRQADGFLDGGLLADRRLTFWTGTLWRDQADMRRYMTGGAHAGAMPKLARWCDEASVVHWTTADPVIPDWAEADRRMRAEGRPSRLRHPSAAHADLAYEPPRLTGGVPIRAASGRSSQRR